MFDFFKNQQHLDNWAMSRNLLNKKFYFLFYLCKKFCYVNSKKLLFYTYCLIGFGLVDFDRVFFKSKDRFVGNCATKYYFDKPKCCSN